MRTQRWGKIVNVSSMGGRMTLPGGAFYHATKYAVEALSDAMRFELQGFGIDVVVIEPGAIKTDFARTAIANVDKVTQRESPYAAFNAQVAAKIKDAFEGPMAMMAGKPETVAQTIERAITASRPRTRYLITPAAHVILKLKEWLPDRGFDAFLRTQFTPPRPG
jgi:NAD(P)-dependent dehydrogenase (short-subunit alcohol dehydrogenase family)